jgi:hypothetical protein
MHRISRSAFARSCRRLLIEAVFVMAGGGADTSQQMFRAVSS